MALDGHPSLKFGEVHASFFPGSTAQRHPTYGLPNDDIPEELNGGRPAQGEVTANRSFLPDLIQRRQASSSNVAPELRIEAVMRPEQLHIFEGQVLVMPVRPRNWAGGRARRIDQETAHAVFSSFRGMRVGKRDADNPDLWRHSYAFAGFAKANAKIGQVTEGRKVAAFQAGGFNVKTNNWENINPGNMLRLQNPSPVAADRLQVANAAAAVGVNVDVAAPSIRPEQPENLLHVIQDHVSAYINSFSNGGSERDAYIMQEPYSRKDNDTELRDSQRFMLETFARGSSSDFARNLVLAEQLGLVTLNIPVDNLGALASFSSAFDNKSTRNLDSDLGRTIVSVDPATGTVTETTDVGLVQKTRIDRIKRAKILYELLGLIPLENLPRASPQLRETIMFSAVRGLVPPSSANEELREQMSITRTGPHQHSDNLDAAERAMSLEQINHARQTLLSFYMWYNEAAAERVGKAMRAAKPGEEVDIVV